MSEWFRAMFPNASGDDELVPLYGLKTPAGSWRMQTPVRTFRFQALREANEFYLAFDGVILPAVFPGVFEAVRAVVDRRIGLSEWDGSGTEVPDSLDDWDRLVTDRTIANFIGQWLERQPHGSLRELVDYFEHDATALIDREEVADVLQEMILTAQLDWLPSAVSAPAELDEVVRLAAIVVAPRLVGTAVRHPDY